MNNNEYINNKDDFSLLVNDLTTSSNFSKDKAVSGYIMRFTILFLIVLTLYVYYMYYKIIYNIGNNSEYNRVRIFIRIAIIAYSYLIYKNYIRIAYYISKFIENNFLFKI
jgi:hypothetical protein